MIVTLTLNPSLDRTVTIDRMIPGAVLRTTEPTLEPGGKGVNVTRALTANGVPSVAIVPVAGPEGAELARLLEHAGVDGRYVPVSGRTRSNLSVADSSGQVTKLNEPGSRLRANDLGAIRTTLRSVVSPGDWLVISGSATPGLMAAEMTSLVETAIASGISVAVDTSGDSLAAAADAGPRILKPNRYELVELVGRDLTCIADVIEGAREIRTRGVETVIVSLGSDGAVLVGERVVLVGESHVEHPVSTVGAGDSFLGGFLARYSADESDLESALIEGLRWGAAATTLPGSAVPGPADLAPMNVQLVWQPDLDRPLVAT